MSAKVYELKLVRVRRTCPWCDECLESNVLDEIRKFDRTHVRCRDVKRA
jgi:hypothetical protein